MAEIKLKRKKNIVKGSKGFLHPRRKYQHGRLSDDPKLDLKDQYETGSKVHDIGGVRKPGRKVGNKVLYKVGSEENLYTSADPNMPIMKTGHKRDRRHSTSKTGTRPAVNKEHARWLKERAKARATLKKRNKLV